MLYRLSYPGPVGDTKQCSYIHKKAQWLGTFFLKPFIMPLRPRLLIASCFTNVFRKVFTNTPVFVPRVKHQSHVYPCNDWFISLLVMGNSGIAAFKAWGTHTTEHTTTVTGFSRQHTNVLRTWVITVGHMWISQKIFHFTCIKSPERLAKIAMADYISSHPGGVLGKVFN